MNLIIPGGFDETGTGIAMEQHPKYDHAALNSFISPSSSLLLICRDIIDIVRNSIHRETLLKRYHVIPLILVVYEEDTVFKWEKQTC